MKLILQVGPDTRSFKTKSKRALRNGLNRAMGKRKPLKENHGHLGWTFKGRVYTYNELKEAVILTLNEFFEANKEIVKNV